MIATPQGTAGKKDGRSGEEGRRWGREPDEWDGVKERWRGIWKMRRRLERREKWGEDGDGGGWKDKTSGRGRTKDWRR